MKKFRFLTSVIITFTMIFTTAVPSFALDENENNNYNFLLEQGYSAEYLDNFTDTALQKMTEMIDDNSYISNVAVDKIVFNESSNMTRGTIDEDSLILNISYGTICQNGTDKIISVLVTASWEWAAWKPLYRGEDAITINWDNDVFDYDDAFYAQDVYKSNETDEWSTFNEYSVLAVSNQGGIGHWTNLKAFNKYVGGAMLFLLEPKISMKTGTSVSTRINVNYVHSQIPITGLDFSVFDVGVGISWNISCESMSDTSVFRFSQ